MPVSQPQTGSLSASSSTLKKRSQVIEKFGESVASATKAADDITHQTATSIKRNKDQFLESFSDAGLNILQSFTLKQVSNYKDVLFGKQKRKFSVVTSAFRSNAAK